MKRSLAVFYRMLCFVSILVALGILFVSMPIYAMTNEAEDYDLNAYDLLTQASQLRNPSAWNAWKKEVADTRALRLQGSQFADFDLQSTDFVGMQLQGVNFYRSNLKDADLSESDLSGSNFYAAILQNANLSHSDLRHSTLYYVDLRNANFSHAQLQEVCLPFADLRSADFSYAQLQEANLYSADLRGIDLRYADLRSADLRRASLEGAVLDHADMRGVIEKEDIPLDGGLRRYRKPVIYLYPQQTAEITVKLEYNGTLEYTYPPYNDGWLVTAQPDGTLTNYADGREYSYLFWDGISDVEYDFNRGFVVKGSDTVTFLQEKLAFMGLTPREYNEFIVYWLPFMQRNPWNLITFQEKRYTDNAVLTVEPKPDSILRVFMAFRPLQEPLDIPEQTLKPFERKGFTVVEWGGSECN